MPSAPKKPCSHHGCGKLVAKGKCDCGKVKPKVAAQTLKRESSCQRGYGYRWQQTRIGFLRKHPLCCQCAAKGITEAATELDHIIPHKKNWDVFWDRDNWQPLCKSCHSQKTSKEDGGFGHAPRQGGGGANL